jgi:hypothetical protein
VVSSEDGGKLYDEIACQKHGEELYKHSDEKAPGVKKIFAETTGVYFRGDAAAVWKIKCENLLAENQRLKEVVRMQTEALEKIEYVGMGGYTACPRCMGEGGHGEDCEIPIAIKAGKDVLNESHRS